MPYVLTTLFMGSFQIAGGKRFQKHIIGMKYWNECKSDIIIADKNFTKVT